MNKRKPYPLPEIGQKWIDCDKRIGSDRQMQIVKIEDGYAFGVLISTGRRVKIRMDRMRPTATGWRLKGYEIDD